MMKLSYSEKTFKVTYDVVAKEATMQTFVERRKVITNELNEDTTTVPYIEKVEQELIKGEIDRLTTMIWNCKNTLRFSQDNTSIIDRETKRMSDSHDKIDFLKTLVK